MTEHRPSSVAPGRPGSAVYPTSPISDGAKGIATGRDVEWEPLVDFRRNDVSENTIHGAIAWAHGSEVFHSFGGNVLCYGRCMLCVFYTYPTPPDRCPGRMPGCG